MMSDMMKFWKSKSVYFNEKSKKKPKQIDRQGDQKLSEGTSK